MKKDKHRDIARGVLPSTARRSAREGKRDFHHTHRRNQNQINHEILRSTMVVDDDGHLYTDPELFDEFEPRHVIDGYHARTKKEGVGYDDMGEVVSHRRGHDKLGPLLSWARATERIKMEGWSNEDKYAYFKAVLPDTLQGRHALGHVESALGISNDEYSWRFRFSYSPVTKQQFRAALMKFLGTNKGRFELRDFILDTVPVAAHRSEAKNKKRARVEARDENGEIRYYDPIYGHIMSPRRAALSRERRPIMVDVYIPQIVAVTCDDCSFLRNGDLVTNDDIARFVELVWDSPKDAPYWYHRRRNEGAHSYLSTIRNFILDGGKADD
jgi:hypothetical protein